MKENLQTAIGNLAAKIDSTVNHTAALQYTQAILNLANAIETLASTARQERMNDGKS